MSQTKVAARWTPDCQGKQDYDGPIVEISTRYWPRGGGFSLVTGGRWEGNEARPQIRPSAKSSICIVERTGPGEYDVELVSLAVLEVDGDTEEEVKAAVERWAEGQHAKIVEAMKAAFGGAGT